MADYGPETYGDVTAEHYDEWVGASIPERETLAAADFLAELVGDGSALELGVGTGRVALPLAARGARVEGVDGSQKMIDKLRAKQGGHDLQVHSGDLTDLALPGPYRVVFSVLNTIFCLPDQEDQLRCLRGAARLLEPGGVFVSEAIVPDVTRFDRGQRANISHIGADEVRLDVSRRDPLTDVVTSSHVVLSERGARLHTVRNRPIGPGEHDLLCRLAGLRLHDRFGGWQQEPFTAASAKHISIYTLD